MNSQVKAKCKNCEGFAPADSFRLHYKYKQVVCPACFSGRTDEKRAKEQKVEAAPKPAGWDIEDEYLEKVARLKEKEESPRFKKIPGSNLLQGSCLKCKYNFRYDPFRKQPRTCPYCDEEIPKFRTFNLL